VHRSPLPVVQYHLIAKIALSVSAKNPVMRNLDMPSIRRQITQLNVFGGVVQLAALQKFRKIRLSGVRPEAFDMLYQIFKSDQLGLGSEPARCVSGHISLSYGTSE